MKISHKYSGWYKNIADKNIQAQILEHLGHGIQEWTK